MEIYITKVLPWYPNSVKLQWDVENPDPGILTFVVERSGSPEGPWTTVISGLDDTYLYTDPLDTEETNILSLARDIYYRITVNGTVYSPVVNLDGQAETTQNAATDVIGPTISDEPQYEASPGNDFYERPDPGASRRRLRLYRRGILRQELIGLKNIYGVEFALLKRRHFGERCTECYDPSTRTAIDSHCSTCYGTSWVGGYFPAIDLLGQRLNSQIQHTHTASTGKDDINRTQIRFLDFPRIDEGDILVEKANNRRFVVLERYHTSLKNVKIHQRVSVSELGRSASEYGVSAGL